MMVSARSRLAAGVFAAAAGTALVSPVAVPTAAVPSVSAIVSPAVQLSAALTPLAQPDPAAASTASAVGETPGDWIINAYFTVQPWVEYGVEVFAWATEWLPWPIGLLAPQADIIYSGWQPFAESVAFALAYLVDGQLDLVLPTLTNGIQIGISTFIQNEIAWIASFFPPLPPIGFAAAAPPAAAAAEARSRAAAASEPAVEAEPTAPGAGTEVVAAQSQSTEAAAVAQAEVEPAEVEPATVEPATVEPATVEPATVEPATVDPATVELPAVAPAAVTEEEPAPRTLRQSARSGLRTPRPAPAAATDTSAVRAATQDSPENKPRKSARASRGAA